MIILTEPAIKGIGVKRISKTVNFGCQSYCLAEVIDTFNLSKKDMIVYNIDFWYELCDSQVDASNYKLRKYQGGIIEGIMEQLNLSKEVNLAFAIYAIQSDRKADFWQVWDRSIKS